MLINNHGIKNNKKNKIEYHVINIEGMMNLEKKCHFSALNDLMILGKDHPWLLRHEVKDERECHGEGPG